MARKWVRRGLAGCGFILLAAGIWAGANWGTLQTKFAAHRLNSAATDEDRAKWAEALAAHGDEGSFTLVELLKTGEPPVRTAAAVALAKHLDALPATDARAAVLCGQLLEVFLSFSTEADREAMVALLPTIVQRAGAMHAAKCREAVTAALKMTSVAARLAAISGAAHPTVAMRGDIVVLLNAAEPEVRRAALFAVGPATDGEPVVSDEELFHWLHDPDVDVRKICHGALVSRGRTDGEIALGRRLVDPDAGERLKLLLDLRYDDDLADPEPWFERLSHDVDPGVRAGAARSIVELNAEKKLPVPGWVAQLAEADPDPTVRRIALFYRSEPRAVDAGLRLINGP